MKEFVINYMYLPHLWDLVSDFRVELSIRTVLQNVLISLDPVSRDSFLHTHGGACTCSRIQMHAKTFSCCTKP
jgi:hypothetical protein